MHFAGFYEITDKEILESDIYKKLLSWALGEEPPPDLIIIGYGTWMMLLEFLRNDFRPPLTLLHNQWDIHAAVLRMLLNLKDTTRVLFLSQNMQKPHAYKEKEPAPFEKRSRMPWIHFSNLGWLNLREKLTTFHAPYAGGNKSDFWRAVFARRSNAFSFLPKSISFRDRFRILMDELPSVSKESHRSQHESSSDLEGHSGIWFWDSTQPVAFASLRDCDTLFHHDPMSSYIIPYAYNIDPKTTHPYTYGLLSKLDFPPEKLFQLRNRRSEEVHSPTANVTKEIRPNDEPYTNTFFRKMKTLPKNVFVKHSESSFEPGNLYLDQLDDYYDKFATAYAFQDLYCRNPMHAGYLVKQVEALQILNMICNQFMDIDSSFCCRN
ncbi:uncharacterized protein LOC108677710 [Hyalella azteca]|uniref:Uncharacterized protein LOC108677710 n=1 Tax=Hyalella azteca TaxID=294128 RepID=A0A8B7P8H8_HYAAZ|nr:uncharacterized protein LOC108677710 [Hyalella azteca]